ncbi:MAG: GGDEF domain-containing protein, partial [Colwellia sp.]|nr:GGDEF domain-containing protein [Colwellia sp.]
PFALIRFYQHDTIIALIDASIAFVMFSLFIYLYISKNIKVAKSFFAVFAMFAVLTSITVKGESQVLWVFPTIVSIYYLMSLKAAQNTIVLFIVLLLFTLYSQTNLIYLLTIAMTSILTSALAYLVFRSYNKQHEELESLASIDALTSSGNRRALDLQLSKIISSQQREPYEVCLVLFDLDHFKGINDEYGHAAGDEILITLCDLIRKNIRALDSLYRYGGDEFILLPLNMNLEATMKLAEKVRKVIELHEFHLNIPVTVSIGVAEFRLGDTSDSWINRADKLLYKVKSAGRNKVFSK